MSLEIIKNEVKDKNTMSIVIRNAHRLQRFANEILDVTRIEGKTLNLYKETFDINDKIQDIINDITANILTILRSITTKIIAKIKVIASMLI